MRWEYLVVHEGLDEEDLNARGREGWELVTVLFDPTVYALQSMTYYFKRQRAIG